MARQAELAERENPKLSPSPASRSNR